MKRPWLWRLSVATSPEAGEAVSELVTRLFGLSASTFTDAQFRASTVTVYSTNRTQFSVSRLQQLHASLKRIRSCGLKTRPARVSLRLLRREDWAESWKKHFRPSEIGPALLVKPSWSGCRPRRGQAVIVLDPGLSFGTGQHPTTAFCLRQIVHRRKPGTRQSFLDIGTGSGILAIAAAKLDCAPVAAFDSDPEAVRAAKANARENGVAGHIHISHEDVTKLPRQSRRCYDLVCANLLSPLLLLERDRIVNLVARCGTLVLAGILKTEFAQVQRAYERAGLRLVASRTEKEWRSGAFEFKRARRKEQGTTSD